MNTVRALLVAGALAAVAANCQAGLTTLSPRLCGWQAPLSAVQQDRLLRVADILRRELDGSDHRVALIARSGLNLERLGIRYSHAGVSLKANADAPWAVRQLYYACEQGRPRLYDQGLAGFLFGTENPSVGFISVVLLPEAEGAALERAALDRPRALRLLAGRYSANAHAFSVAYQNCNQWLVELMASAWGGLDDDREDLRERAQHWLADQGYRPYPIELDSRWLMFAAGFVPWVHTDDHPPDDLFAMRFRTSLPASIEAFARQHVPGARRIELCHDERQVVIRAGWDAFGDGCHASAGDRTMTLE
ncbi:MAG: DUF2145 domain-containing protein [Aquincola sp.]|nr:DUF2145 domain-containing protein [Aquincola sp.]MDH4290255.1 DUF2145 domain-containing protein [Aquincola sp.]